MPQLMTAANLILVLLLLAVGLLSYLLIRGPRVSTERGGKVLLLVGLFLLPAIVLAAGTGERLQQSTSTEFCLSCHEMGVYNQSLHIDDNEPIPALHFQNRYVDRDHACYTCHTDYTMFGGVKAKLNGMRHLYYHYIAGVPEEIKIAAPFPNRNCLSCHDGARSFVQSENHDSDDAPMEKILSGEASCLASGCHDVAHATEDFDDYKFWSAATMPVRAVKADGGDAEGDDEEDEDEDE